MSEVKGKAGIVAKIICDSVSPEGVRLTTYELIYPRMVHSELLTHGMLVRNAASSRAIPFAKMQEQLTALPVRFGAANKGMQDSGDCDNDVEGKPYYEEGWGDAAQLYSPEQAWNMAKEDAKFWAEAFYKAGYAKQIYNRFTETFQMMKTVLSGTEFANFFWLRDDEAADPSLAELARCMREAREESVPQVLKPGEWHLPYVTVDYFDIGNGIEQHFYATENYSLGDSISLEDAIKMSCARTAAVSFRAEDYDLPTCLRVYDKLVGNERKHASAMQHQATPMNKCTHELRPGANISSISSTWQKGISHMDSKGQLWSAQFKGWIMWRKTIPGENYEEES